MKQFHESKSYIKQVTISVKDLDKSVYFYENVMKLDVLNKTLDQVVLGNKQVPLVTLVRSEKQHRMQEGLYHIAFLLKDEVQLASWLNSNLSYKRFVGASHHGVSKAIYLEDPDGNGIEIYSDIDDSLWQKRNNQIQMVTEPLNIDELLKKAEDLSDYDIVIGHLHLQTKDVDKAAAFYQMLGFNITLDMSSAIFMSFNGYHHHIAFNQWNQYRMDKHDEKYIDLQSYEIWYEDKQSFLDAKARFVKKGIQFVDNGDFMVVKDPLNIDVKLIY